MLWVWARRQGLLLSVWAKPTLYLSFFLSLGNSAARTKVPPKPDSAKAPADAVNSERRVMIMMFLPLVARGPGSVDPGGAQNHH